MAANPQSGETEAGERQRALGHLSCRIMQQVPKDRDSTGSPAPYTVPATQQAPNNRKPHAQACPVSVSASLGRCVLGKNAAGQNMMLSNPTTLGTGTSRQSGTRA